MEQVTTEIKSYSMPAVRVMLNIMNYDLLGTIEVTITDCGYPYQRRVLYARHRANARKHVVVMLGDIGWEPRGFHACIDYKIFKFGSRQPKKLKYWSVGTMNLYWEWKERYGSTKNLLAIIL